MFVDNWRNLTQDGSGGREMEGSCSRDKAEAAIADDSSWRALWVPSGAGEKIIPAAKDAQQLAQKPRFFGDPACG